ncbi:MAG: response regulator [Anaerolineae bacterium]|nr:response regulator [Anaerolineae bacterium]
MSSTALQILIVDDQPSARDTLKGLLHPEGYQLTFAASGLEALACLEQGQPDTILLDVMMPGMDGFEVCRRLKATGKWRHIPIILITALDGPEDIAAGLDAGADDFISKPVQTLELRARVRSMLRLKKQFDDLQAMLQLREDMVQMIVHDFRTPLTVILGLTELLSRQAKLAPETREGIKTINTHTHRLNEYLNDLLMLAKMENDSLILNCSRVNLNELVVEVEENHRPIADAKKIHLRLGLPEQTPDLSLDAKLTQRVLDNLLSNALKFSPAQSTVTITVEYPHQTNGEAGSPAFRLKIADEGPGVPEPYQQSIFDKFKIIDLHKKEVPQLGLGLAFCKLVVEAHGGTIFVENNQPQGAVFTIEI